MAFGTKVRIVKFLAEAVVHVGVFCLDHMTCNSDEAREPILHLVHFQIVDSSRWIPYDLKQILLPPVD